MDGRFRRVHELMETNKNYYEDDMTLEQVRAWSKSQDGKAMFACVDELRKAKIIQSMIITC